MKQLISKKRYFTIMNTIKPFSIFFLMLLLSSSLYAQLPEEIQWKHLQKNYAADSTKLELSLNNKLLQGKYKIPLDNNSFALYDIKKGLISGEAFWYTNNGNVECKLNYKNGVRNGLKENYDSDGATWLREEYKDGKKDGTSEMYSSGKISSKTEYKKGKKDGLSISYSNGQVMTQTSYKEDKRNGLSSTFFNGVIATENNYLNDVQDGLGTMYAMGKKNMDAIFKNGQRHGVAHMYKPDGTVLFESYFLFGTKVSKEEYEKYLKN